ncbi:MAG: hypothetical protein ACR2KT_08375 [Methylocella sp.]
MPTNSLEIESINAGHDLPGVVLGPYKSLIATSLYFNEIRRREKWRKWGGEDFSNNPKRPFRIDAGVRDRILGAFLLFGKIDASAGQHLLDAYTYRHGWHISAREMFGDFGPLHPEPFSHSLESTAGILHFDPGYISPEIVDPVVPEVVKALRHAGYEATTLWGNRRNETRFEITATGVVRL